VGPTSVQLVAFTATAAGAEVALVWETAAEFDTLGFHLYRAAAEAGPYVRLTADLIAAQGDTMTGARYQYVDRPGAGIYIIGLRTWR